MKEDLLDSPSIASKRIPEFRPLSKPTADYSMSRGFQSIEVLERRLGRKRLPSKLRRILMIGGKEKVLSYLRNSQVALSRMRAFPIPRKYRSRSQMKMGSKLRLGRRVRSSQLGARVFRLVRKSLRG